MLAGDCLIKSAQTRQTVPSASVRRNVLEIDPVLGGRGLS